MADVHWVDRYAFGGMSIRAKRCSESGTKSVTRACGIADYSVPIAGENTFGRRRYVRVVAPLRESRRGMAAKLRKWEQDSVRPVRSSAPSTLVKAVSNGLREWTNAT
jgi:hypothetical protein